MIAEFVRSSLSPTNEPGSMRIQASIATEKQPTFSGLACISRPWQRAVEKILFRSITINEDDDLGEVSRYLTQLTRAGTLRKNYVHSVIHHQWKQQVDIHGQFEALLNFINSHWVS